MRDLARRLMPILLVVLSLLFLFIPGCSKSDPKFDVLPPIEVPTASGQTDRISPEIETTVLESTKPDATGTAEISDSTGKAELESSVPSPGTTAPDVNGSSSEESTTASTASKQIQDSKTTRATTPKTSHKTTDANATSSPASPATTKKATSATKRTQQATTTRRQQPDAITVTISVDARTVLSNPGVGKKALDTLNGLIDSGKASAGGSLFNPAQLTLAAGTSAYDALLATGLVVGASNTSMGIYINSIQGLAGLDGGQKSGWLYLINGTVPNVGAGSYKLSPGDRIDWRYTVTGGSDIYY